MRETHHRSERQVLLVRHGRPLWDERSPIRGTEFGSWVRGYDEAPLDPSTEPPVRLREQTVRFECVVTSTLRRSIESARLLVPGRSLVHDSVFDEASQPTNLPFRFRLPAKVWDAVSRGAWLCGWTGTAESFTEARARAVSGAVLLMKLAQEHGRVVLAGHGMMNRMLARELRRHGWAGTLPPRDYWGASLLAEKGESQDGQ